MAPKLSFILPIYNVARYLPQCIDSILSQMTCDCEIILVDDGSTDGSGAICDAYAQGDPRITVLHKENGGLSSARNAGMEIAQGDYVCFVDSDDYLAHGSVGPLLDWLEGGTADILFLQCDKVYPDGTLEPMADGITADGIRGKSREQVLAFLAGCPKFPASAWAKLWRRDFLRENGLEFPGGRLSEDLGYCLDAFLLAKSFDVLEAPFYRYRQSREGSITHTVTPKYYFDTAWFVSETARRFPAPADAAASYALSAAAYEYAILLWQHLSLTGENRARALAFLREYQWVLRHGRSAKTRMLALVSGVLGIRITAKILNIYMENRQ